MACDAKAGGTSISLGCPGGPNNVRGACERTSDTGADCVRICYDLNLGPAGSGGDCSAAWAGGVCHWHNLQVPAAGASGQTTVTGVILYNDTNVILSGTTTIGPGGVLNPHGALTAYQVIVQPGGQLHVSANGDVRLTGSTGPGSPAPNSLATVLNEGRLTLGYSTIGTTDNSGSLTIANGSTINNAITNSGALAVTAPYEADGETVTITEYASIATTGRGSVAIGAGSRLETTPPATRASDGSLPSTVTMAKGTTLGIAGVLLNTNHLEALSSQVEIAAGGTFENAGYFDAQSDPGGGTGSAVTVMGTLQNDLAATVEIDDKTRIVVRKGGSMTNAAGALVRIVTGAEVDNEGTMSNDGRIAVHLSGTLRNEPNRVPPAVFTPGSGRILACRKAVTGATVSGLPADAVTELQSGDADWAANCD